MSTLVKILLFSIVVILLGFGGCKNDSVSPAPQGVNRFVFEIETINYAWGYAHLGIMIDSAGAVHHYSYDGSDTTWHPADTTTWWTQSQLASKFSHHDSLLAWVNRDSLKRYEGKIASAEAGAPSDTIRIGADMGAVTYIAYQFNSTTKAYYAVKLRTEGDWVFYNQSVAAVELSAWLKRVEASTHPIR